MAEKQHETEAAQKQKTHPPQVQAVGPVVSMFTADLGVGADFSALEGLPPIPSTAPRRRAALLQMERLAGNRSVLRYTSGGQASGARLVQRNNNPPADPAQGASMNVSLSGITVRVPPGSAYQAGTKGPQALRILLRLMVGGGYTAGMEQRVYSDLQALPNVRLEAWMAQAATAGESMGNGFVLVAPMAPALMNLLRDQYHVPLALQPGQVAVIEAGVTANQAWRALQDPRVVRQIGQDLPDWYRAHGEYLFVRQMAQQGALLDRYREARELFTRTRARAEALGVADVLREIVRTLNISARVWTAIRGDQALLQGETGQILQTVDRNPDEVSNFLHYTHTQTDLARRAERDPAARSELVARYFRYIGRARVSGDEAVLQTPGQANTPPLPATLTSSPVLQAPLFDASINASHTFFMNIQYSDVFEAMAMWGFTWDYLRIPPAAPSAAGQPATGGGGAGGGGPTDAGARSGGATPEPRFETPQGWGAIYSRRMMQATEYSDADIRRVISSLGPVGIGALTLVGANAILRYVGTAISTFFDQMFEPRHARTMLFPDPGLYMVRCRAAPVRNREGEVVRVPSVAYLIVHVRSPQAMAQERVRLANQSETETQAEIARLQAELARNPDQPQVREQLAALRRSAGPVGEMLRGQAADMDTSLANLRQQLTAAQNENDLLAVRRLEEQIRAAERMRGQLGTIITQRGERGPLNRPNARVERLHTSFVSDRGQTINLLVEATETAHEGDNFRYFVSDSTTPNSRAQEGSGTSKPIAILNALKAILESAGGYGRGHVAIQIDGVTYQRRIEADAGQLLMEAVENVTMVASLALVAAAPFTGGSSLALLLPVGVVGALPSAYRLADRAQAGTFQWDMQTAMDIVNIAGAAAGLGQAAAGTRQVTRVGRALMIAGFGADGLGVVMMGAGVIEQLAALEGLPEGERQARTMEIIGMAMLNAGMMVGQSLMRQSMEMRSRMSQTGDQGGPGGGRERRGLPPGPPEPRLLGPGEPGTATTQPGAQTTQQSRAAWLRSSQQRLQQGGAVGRGAGREVIAQTGDIRQVRAMVREGGQLGPTAEASVSAARAELITQAREAALAGRADLTTQDLGTPGLGSDVDVTFNPRDRAAITTPEAVARAVRQSGEAARAFVEHLRQQTGGHPEHTLDANAYTYTGMEADVPIPAAQQQQAAAVFDAAALVAVRRGMEMGNPRGAAAAWQRFRTAALRRTPASRPGMDPSQARVRDQARAEMTRQFADADAMYERVAQVEAEARQRLAAGEHPPSAQAMGAEASILAVQAHQQRLIEALQQTPIDWVRVRQLQTEIKLMEPGAYATRAGVADVVEHQQALASASRHGRPGETVPSRREARPGEPRPADVTLGPAVTDPRALAQSSADNLGQLMLHLHGSLMDRLRAVAKYCARIDHSRAAAGMRFGVPEISSNFSAARAYDVGPIGTEASLRTMVMQWAAGRPELARSPFARQTEAFIAEHVRWAQNEVQNLNVQAITTRGR